MPDDVKDDGGLRPEDLDRLQTQEALTDRERATREALERAEFERDTQPMSPESVANFETFPPVPDADAPTPPGRGFLDQAKEPMSADTVRNFETFTDSDGNRIETDSSRILDMQFQVDEPAPETSAPQSPAATPIGGGGVMSDIEESLASDAFLADGPPSETRANLPSILQPMTPDSVANFETFPALPDDYDPKPEPQDEGIEVMQAPGAGGGTRTMFAVAGGVVLLGLALVALLMRGGSAPPATSSTAGMLPPAAAQPGGNAAVVTHAPCTARTVSPAEAEAIPANQRWQVGVYCIGGHWYPVEQFKTDNSLDCRAEPGVIGGSFLTTKSGGPAYAIDDESSIPNPGPKECGFLTFGEMSARTKDVNERLPNGMFPTSTTRYRAFQARAGTGSN